MWKRTVLEMLENADALIKTGHFMYGYMTLGHAIEFLRKEIETEERELYESYLKEVENAK